MKKFQNKYRIPSARLQNWDYGANGAYFIASLLYAPDAVNVLALLKNVFFSFWGNYVGGGLIIGLFYAYLNDNHHHP